MGFSAHSSLEKVARWHCPSLPELLTEQCEIWCCFICAWPHLWFLDNLIPLAGWIQQVPALDVLVLWDVKFLAPGSHNAQHSLTNSNTVKSDDDDGFQLVLTGMGLFRSIRTETWLIISIIHTHFAGRIGRPWRHSWIFEWYLANYSNNYWVAFWFANFRFVLQCFNGYDPKSNRFYDKVVVPESI